MKNYFLVKNVDHVKSQNLDIFVEKSEPGSCNTDKTKRINAALRSSPSLGHYSHPSIELKPKKQEDILSLILFHHENSAIRRNNSREPKKHENNKYRD